MVRLVSATCMIDIYQTKDRERLFRLVARDAILHQQSNLLPNLDPFGHASFE